MDWIDIIVSPTPPRIMTFPVKPLAGGRITFTLVGSTHPKGTEYQWDFGDSTSTTTTDLKVNHQYKKTGRYTISVKTQSHEVTSSNLDLTLQKGDILVHSSSGFFAKLTPGPWSHAAMYIGNDQTIEATKSGVHIHSLEDWSYPEDTCVAVFRINGLSDSSREAIVNWGKTKDGRPYDFPSIAMVIKQLDCPHDFWTWPFCMFYYCSELVWASYRGGAGINLHPIPKVIVLPTTLVCGKYQSTHFIGAHIEEIPNEAKDWTAYFQRLVNGDFVEPIKNSPESDNVSVLLIQGINHEMNLNMISLNVTDQKGRVLSDTLNTIPDSGLDTIDYDGDGVSNDKMAGISFPSTGEYNLSVSWANTTNQQGRWSLNVGAWDTFTYAWIIPINNTTSSLYSEPIHFRIDEKDLARMITFPSGGYAPLNISCIDLSKFQSTNNSWNFGDATVLSDVKTVFHQYTQPGTYNLSLSVTNHTTSFSVIIPVIVQPQPLQAGFDADRTEGTLPFQVSFTDTSCGMPGAWNWSFGDGTFSHVQNPVHTYSGVGRYTVTLGVSDSNQQSVIRKPVYININSGRGRERSGFLWITSEPQNASVICDDVNLGETPLISSSIPTGIHRITVSRPGYLDWNGNIQVNFGEYTYVPKVILLKKYVT
jgi:PKD repeat protein